MDFYINQHGATHTKASAGDGALVVLTNYALRNLRRAAPNAPTMPVPSRIRPEGSGVDAKSTVASFFDAEPFAPPRMLKPPVLASAVIPVFVTVKMAPVYVSPAPVGVRSIGKLLLFPCP